MYYRWGDERIVDKVVWWSARAERARAAVATLGAYVLDAVEAGEFPAPEPPGAVGLERNVEPMDVSRDERRFTLFVCHPPGRAGRFAGHPVDYKCLAPAGDEASRRGAIQGVTGVIFVAGPAPEDDPDNQRALRDLVARLRARHDISGGTTAAAASALFGAEGPVALVVARDDGALEGAAQAVDPEALRRALFLPESVPVCTGQARPVALEAFEAMARRLRPAMERALERGRIPRAEPQE